jgi:hypothetical protein
MAGTLLPCSRQMFIFSPMNRLAPIYCVAGLLSLGLTACVTRGPSHPATPAASVPTVSTPAVPTSADFASPDQLTAAYTNGDVVLHWRNNATADGGNWVEFATPGSEFTKLEVALADARVTDYVHPQVAPETAFIYHINPFFGLATQPVGITTGIASTNDPAMEEGPLPADTNAVPVQSTPKVSIRSMSTFTNATPTGLTATLSSPTSVDLHWTDVASDEDGYLLEVAADGGRFVVCALLPPDTTSFRKTVLPAETKCSFRVRAFFYGKPSETASVLTPPELKTPVNMK